MSRVQTNKIVPQSFPLVLMDGFNDLETFVVNAGQTLFTSSLFTKQTPIRIFKRLINGFEELSFSFTNDNTFSVTGTIQENDEIFVYGITGYVQKSSVENFVITNSTATSYQITEADLYGYIRISNASVISVVIDTNANVPVPVGAYFEVEQAGTGVLTVSGVAGVTVNSPSGSSTSSQFQKLRVLKVAEDEWVIS